MEVYDNERLEITKPSTRYALDSFHIPAETANAFKEDLKTMGKSFFLPPFKEEGCHPPPFFAEFADSLTLWIMSWMTFFLIS